MSLSESGMQTVLMFYA